MNKFFIFIFIFILFAISVSSILALDIAYVVRSPGNLDLNEIAIKDFIVNEGHSVSFLDDVVFDASDYDLILVSESVSDIRNIFDHRNHRTLFLSNSAAKKKGLSSSLGSSSGRYVNVERIDHFIIDGFSLDIFRRLQIYSNQDGIDYLLGCNPINSKNLLVKSDLSKSVLLALDTDALLLIDGDCRKRDKQIFERNLFFGLTEATNWNSNSEELFRKSIEWLTESESDDVDEDGYDAISAGGDDCNDNNAGINPGASEIAYNGVDEDCSGSDLTDVDEDGYDAISAGGDDCNDNDSTIHPGGEDGKDCNNLVINNGPLEFGNINVCNNKNSKINIDLRDLDGDYKIGDQIKFSIRVRNNFNIDKDFDVKAYFYDLTEEDIIEDDKDSLYLDNGEEDIVDFEFDVPDDLNEDNNYVVLVVVEDDECNQEYDTFDVERDEHYVVIDKFEAVQSNLVCGDYVNLNVVVKNLGSEDEDIYIVVKSAKLGIDEKTDTFEIERFDEDDEISKSFVLKTSENIDSGEYIIRTDVHFNNKRVSSEETLVLECNKKEIKQDSIDILGLSESIVEVSNSEVPGKVKSNLFKYLFLVMLILFAGIAGYVTFYFWRN